MSSSDASPLIRFILESERNLRVAEAAFASFEVARDQIIRGFCERLGRRLTKKLTGWQFEYLPRFFTDRYGAFDLWKPKWRGQYHLRLEAWEHGDRMIYGVWRDEGNIARRPFTGEILTQVKKVHPSAKARIYYEGEVRLRSPEPDWRPVDVLWQIHHDPLFLADVAGQMLEIATLIERIIDSVVAKRGRR